MWPFSSCDTPPGVDAGCVATDPNAISAAAVFGVLPFVLVFVVTSALAARHIFPRLSHAHDARDGEDHFLPAHAPAALRQAHAEHGSKSWQRRGAALTFGATIGLSAVLGTLILAEILELLAPPVKNLALRLTEPTLLFLLVVLVPWIECRSIVSSAGWSFQRTAKGTLPRVAWTLHIILFSGWLFAFWSVGKAVPAGAAADAMTAATKRTKETHLSEKLMRACLERVGVVGISLMALLAGFASVSSPWHTFTDASARRKRPVTDADVNRKQAGLEATSEMLLTKRHRLQMFERRAADTQAAGTGAARGSRGFVGKMIGSIRGGSSDEAEMKALRMEIAGLETMEENLSSGLSSLRLQRDASARAATTLGRLLFLPSYAFSCYCVYRILATALTTARRASSPSASFAASDPINRFLGLLARHWDPKLDQVAWARTISFALSGVILAASANSVVQTVNLFARWAPGLVRHARANLALVVGQVAATYVISSSLLLRSHLPVEVGSAVGGVLLRGALSPAFVDGWFEGWFLCGSVLTAVGIWVGRKLVGGGFGEDDWDDYGMEEMGAKRS